MVGGDSCASLVASVERAEEDGAGGLGAEEDGAEAHGPGHHGGNGPAGLQGGGVEHPLAGEAAHQRNAHHAADADEPGERGVRHLLREAAELVHVARAGGVLHGAGGEEQAALEESVIEAVEQAGGDGQRRADADAHHHVADLADGGEGQHALQVGLHHGVHDADGHGDGADPHQGGAPGDGPDAEAVHARGEIDAGRDVAGGVEQRADRSGRGHGFGNPGVQRNLHALGHQRDEHQQRRCRR